MEYNWMNKAVCKGEDTDIFFQKGSSIPALRMCWGDPHHSPCPVRVQCLEWACTFNEEEDKYGIFGGYTAPERRRHRQGMQVEPKKIPVAVPIKYYQGKRVTLTGFEHEGLT